jgi:hypothetical protein
LWAAEEAAAAAGNSPRRGRVGLTLDEAVARARGERALAREAERGRMLEEARRRCDSGVPFDEEEGEGEGEEEDDDAPEGVKAQDGEGAGYGALLTAGGPGGAEGGEAPAEGEGQGEGQEAGGDQQVEGEAGPAGRQVGDDNDMAGPELEKAACASDVLGVHVRDGMVLSTALEVGGVGVLGAALVGLLVCRKKPKVMRQGLWFKTLRNTGSVGVGGDGGGCGAAGGDGGSGELGERGPGDERGRGHCQVCPEGDQRGAGPRGRRGQR